MEGKDSLHLKRGGEDVTIKPPLFRFCFEMDKVDIVASLPSLPAHLCSIYIFLDRLQLYLVTVSEPAMQSSSQGRAKTKSHKQLTAMYFTSFYSGFEMQERLSDPKTAKGTTNLIHFCGICFPTFGF